MVYVNKVEREYRKAARVAKARIKATVYASEAAAKRACREIRAMTRVSKCVYVEGDLCGGWKVYVDGAVQDKLSPLSFTVTAGGTCIVYQIASRSGSIMHGHKSWPTHKAALAVLRKFSPTCFVTPVEFIGPLDEATALRVKYQARR